MSPCGKTTSIADRSLCRLDGKPDVTFIDTVADRTAILSDETTEGCCTGRAEVSIRQVAAITDSSIVYAGKR